MSFDARNQYFSKRKSRIFYSIILMTLMLSGQVMAANDESRQLGQATLSKFKGVWILNLFGSRQEMAFQHGRLIAPIVEKTALPSFIE